MSSTNAGSLSSFKMWFLGWLYFRSAVSPLQKMHTLSNTLDLSVNGTKILPGLKTPHKNSGSMCLPASIPHTHQLPTTFSWLLLHRRWHCSVSATTLWASRLPQFHTSVTQVSFALLTLTDVISPNSHHPCQPLLLCSMCPMSWHAAWCVLGAQLLFGERILEGFSTPNTTLPNLCSVLQ